MNNQLYATTGPQPGSAAPRRRHHWLRWTIVGVLALVVVAAVGVVAFVKLQPAPARLALPGPAAANALAGPLDGTWNVVSGSQAGFRVRESGFGLSDEVVGRTGAVTGSAAVSGNQILTATFRVDLTTLTIAGKAQPQFAKSLDTAGNPIAVVTLTRPVALGSGFPSGATVTVAAAGDLTMHGITHPVTINLSGRRDGSTLQAAGSIPVAFSAWNIQGPSGGGFLGSLADHGVAEFQVTLQHA